MSGILTQTPTQQHTHRAASTGRKSGSTRPSPRGGGRQPSGHYVAPPGGHDRVHIPHAPRRNTPNKLRLGGGIVAVLVLLTAVIIGTQASSIHGKATTLKTVDAPGVTATSDFLYAIEDMDAQLANALLLNADRSLAVTRDDAVRAYQQDQSEAEHDLQTAATSSAGDTATLDQLSLVTTLFDAYKDRASRALQLDEQQGGSTAGGTPGTAGSESQVAIVAAYLEANNALTRQTDAQTPDLLSAAQQLTAKDTDAITASSAGAHDAITGGIAAAVTLGVVMFLVLAVFQFRLFKWFHRAFNPALAAATLAALVLAVAGGVAFASTGRTLTDAKVQAFDSVQALTAAKAVSVDANADESRWLLDSGDAARLAADFHDKARTIASLADGDTNTDSGYATALGGEDQQLLAFAQLNADGQPDPANLARTTLTTNSLFGRELRNITFPGEAAAALDAFHRFAVYVADDVKLRGLDRSTPAGLASAIGYDTDAKREGASDADFGLYIKALQQVIDLNQREFDTSMGSAESDSALWSWLPFVFAALIVGLTVAGLKPRLNEYRG